MCIHLGKALTFYGVFRAQQMAAFLQRCESLFTKRLQTLEEVSSMFDREERSIAAIFPTPAEWSLFRSQADVLIPKFIHTVNDSGLYLHVYVAQCLWLFVC